MPPFLAIVGALNAIMTAAPAVESLVTSTKEWIGSLFAAGVISQAEQDQLHHWCDDHMHATLRGEKPPQLVIDPD